MPFFRSSILILLEKSAFYIRKRIFDGSQIILRNNSVKMRIIAHTTKKKTLKSVK